MKRIVAMFAVAVFCFSAAGQTTPKNVKYTFTDASDLTLVGKIHKNTPNPYHRVDTVKYKGFTKQENLQVRMSSGIAVAFTTNSSTISVKTVYLTPGYPTNGNGIAGRGYDLYIKKDGKWLYAASGVQSDKRREENYVLIKDMPVGEKECLMYLPLYSEVGEVKVGIEEGAHIEGMKEPFRYRIGIFGSSYTHGSSTTRAGMTYPAQFSRNTGLQLLSLGCSGNSKLQQYFADVLVDAEVDAFIFDSFSNPSAEQMEERLFPFIEKVQKAHPGKPLIFQRTIRRENRNFSISKDQAEIKRMNMADSLMKIAVKKYPDVYYIYPNATSDDNNASVDGVHPDNYGYTLWAESIEKPVLKILKKYGIK